MKVMKLTLVVVVALVAIMVVAPVLLATGSFVLDPDNIETTLKPGKSYTKTISLLGTLGYYQRFVVEEDYDWINVSPSKGLVGLELIEDLTVELDSSNLENGKYTASVDVWEMLGGKKAGTSSKIEVILYVTDKKPELKMIPRSLEMLPGQIMQVFIANPMPQPITLKINPIDPWIFVNPAQLTIEPGDVGLFFVRSSSLALTAGIWNTSIMIFSTENSAVSYGLHYPITINVPSGVEFNPSQLTKPGSIAVTNKLKRTVFVKPLAYASAEFDIDIFKLTPGERKIINVSWDEDNRPHQLDFQIIGGKLNIHRITVKGENETGGTPPENPPEP